MARGRGAQRRPVSPHPGRAGPDRRSLQTLGETAGGHHGHVLPTTRSSRAGFQWDILASRLRELAFLNKGIEIRFRDEVHDASETYRFDGGIAEFVQYLNRNRTCLHPAVIAMEGVREGVAVEIAMQYVNDKYDETILTYANNINTIEGGTHLSGFRRRSRGPSTTTPARTSF